MIIVNLTKQTTLTFHAKQAKSFWDQLLGLHRKSNPRSLLFRTRFGIHTFFLHDPIDVIVLDSKNRVIKIKENMSPNRVFFWNPRYTIVIELPKGTIRKSKTLLFDTASVSPV